MAFQADGFHPQYGVLGILEPREFQEGTDLGVFLARLQGGAFFQIGREFPESDGFGAGLENFLVVLPQTFQRLNGDGIQGCIGGIVGGVVGCV